VKPRSPGGVLKKLVLSVLGILVLALFASALYNSACVRLLQSRYPVPGTLYQVNGHAMHLYCTGTGSPAVVLEAGLGDDWIYWQKVQPEVAKTTRACSYDRAGVGWSDSQPDPRDAKNIALQLHALLHQANEAGPFLLVGGSAGGFYIREFTAMYPTEAAGLVFVDASVPAQIRELPDAGYSAATARKIHRDAMWDWLKSASGWARLTRQCKGEVEKGLEAYAGLASAEACRPAFAWSGVSEWDDFWRSAEEAAQAACCGDRPVLVISQDPNRSGMNAQVSANQPIWNSLQESLKNLSPHTRRIIARTSGHHVMIDRPDVIVQGVQQLVLGIRTETTDPAEGTTLVQ